MKLYCNAICKLLEHVMSQEDEGFLNMKVHDFIHVICAIPIEIKQKVLPCILHLSKSRFPHASRDSLIQTLINCSLGFD
jgi:ubiquinone biosynthesis protein Coq4